MSNPLLSRRPDKEGTVALVVSTMSYASILFPFNFLGLVSSTIVALGVLQVFFTYFKLQHVRGPLLAALSDAPRLYWVWTKKPFEKHIELHRQYGPLVRLGPNVVSVADPDAIPTIYGFSYNFEKVSRGLGF